MCVSSVTHPEFEPLPAVGRPPPSFEKQDTLQEHFGPGLFKKAEIDEKRDNLHRCLTALARQAGEVVYAEDDDFEDEVEVEVKGGS